MSHKVNTVDHRLKRFRDDNLGALALKRPKPNEGALETFTNSMNPEEIRVSAEATGDKTNVTTRLLLKYDTAQAMYTHEGMSQICILIIRRLISEADLPSPRNKECILKLLTDAARELLMNELELVAWAVYLEKFVWKDMSLSLETLLVYSAFAVKSYMIDDIAMYQTHLSRRFPNFTTKYNEWITKNRTRMGIPARDLNIKYRRLTKPLTSKDDLKLIDYNTYVDEILQISPPYTSMQDRASANAAKLEIHNELSEPEDEEAVNPDSSQQLAKQDSLNEPGILDFPQRQLSFGSFGMMPPFDSFDSINYIPNFSRQNSNSTHQMQLRRTNSKEEVAALPSMYRANSFVSSLINSDFP